MPERNFQQGPLARAVPGYDAEFAEFPQNEYCDAACVAYNLIDAPPNKYSATNDPVPMVRFLFAGEPVRSPKGALLSPKKWTEWIIISKGKSTRFAKLFAGVKNALGVVTEDETALFKIPFQIMVNPKANPMYSEITHIRDGSMDVSGIFYEGKMRFSPYLKYYGIPCPLRFASVKTKWGIKNIEDFSDESQQKSWNNYNSIGEENAP
jgi:hypothetical protein